MSKIEWTEKTWNPVIGCTPVSPGCLNCYAARMALRMQANPATPAYHPRERAERGGGPGDARLEGVWCRCGGEVWYQDMWTRGKASKELRWEAFCRDCKTCDCNGYSSLRAMKQESPAFWGDHKTIRIAEVRNGHPVFTGEVRCLEERLADPLRWRKPSMIFVNSMSDLFHESVPFAFIDKVFAVMALCPKHTFQVLTKRPERMAEYLARPWAEDGDRWLQAVGPLPANCLDWPMSDIRYPLPNVWLGTSVENQKAADERIPHLIKCPAAVRFLSVEPLLGPVDLSQYLWAMDGARRHGRLNALHWVIVGGESGPGARPCDVGWIESVVKQCADAEVPCFVKQLGARIRIPNDSHSRWPREGDGLIYPVDQPGWSYQGELHEVQLNDRKGGDPLEWPEALRVREMPALGVTA